MDLLGSKARTGLRVESYHRLLLQVFHSSVVLDSQTVDYNYFSFKRRQFQLLNILWRNTKFIHPFSTEDTQYYA